MNEAAGGASGAAAAEPDTPGEMLRAERERRGYSVQQAAEDMHLDAWVIEAIEANRFEALGAPVYARGHLRKYAALLGLSPATVIERYEALSGTPVEPTPIPAAMRSARAASSVAACRSCRCGLPLRLRLSPALHGCVFELAVGRRAPTTRRRSEVVAPSRVGADVERAGRAGAAGTGAQQRRRRLRRRRPAAATPAATGAKSGCAWSSARRRGPRSTTPPGKRLMFDMGAPGRVRTVAGVPPLRVTSALASAVNAQVNDRPIVDPASRRDGTRAKFRRSRRMAQ